MTAFYKVDIAAKDSEGYIIFKTATPKIAEIFKDSLISSRFKDEITNIELLCEDYQEGDGLTGVIADLFDEISGIALSARRLLRDDSRSCQNTSWPQIEELGALTSALARHLERAKILEECLNGWEQEPTAEEPVEVIERLHTPMFIEEKSEAETK